MSVLASIECDIPGLRSGGGDAHRAIAAVDALHLHEGALLVRLVAKADESISARLSSHRVGHDLRGLARRKTALEERNEDELVDLGAEVADEDRELGAAIIATGMSVEAWQNHVQGSYRRSTSPPPEAQFSLKTRVELGTGVPFRLSAFCAASAVENSMKQ